MAVAGKAGSYNGRMCAGTGAVPGQAKAGTGKGGQPDLRRNRNQDVASINAGGRA